MKSQTCEGCTYLRQYPSTKKYFCSNSVDAKTSSIEGKSLGLWQIEKLSDVTCNSWKKITKGQTSRKQT